MSETDINDPKDPLGKDRYYHYFVGLSVGSWGACFLLILIPRIIVYLCNRPQKRTSGAAGKNTRTDQVLVEPSFYSRYQTKIALYIPTSKVMLKNLLEIADTTDQSQA